MKNEYRQMNPIIGALCITNKVNGKMLIESSTDVAAKWNRHQMELKFGSHKNLQLQKDWNTFGAENFDFEVLSEIEQKEDGKTEYAKELDILKQMVLEEWNISDELRY